MRPQVSYTFISFVGGQPQGLITSLEHSFWNFPGEIERILLISSRNFSESETVEVIRVAEERDYPEPEVLEWEPDSGEAGPIMAALAGDPRRRILNLSAGMSYSLCMLLAALLREDGGHPPLLANSSKSEVLFHDCADGGQWIDPLVRSCSAAQLLQNQGLGGVMGEERGEIDDICEFLRIRIPEGSLRNVELNGLRFDLVWNDGTDHLSFLHITPDDGEFLSQAKAAGAGDAEDEGKRLRLAHDRLVGGWAGLKGTDHLYDRKLYVLTTSQNRVLQVEEVSHGKAKCFHLGAGRITARRVSRGSTSQIRALRRFLRSALSAPSVTELASGKRELVVPEGSLVMALGPEHATNFNLLSSLPPGISTVVLCHTQNLGDLAKSYRQHFEPGIRVLSVVTDIHGSNLLDVLKPQGGATRIRVNVTPGNKAQAAFLTLWAHSCGASLWSIYGNLITCIDGGLDPCPYAAGDMLDYLRLAGKPAAGTRFGAQEAEPYLALLDFMELKFRQVAHFKPFRQVVGKVETLGGISCERVSDWVLRLTREGGAPLEVTHDKHNAWFEKLAAAALLRCGGTHVYQSVRLNRIKPDGTPVIKNGQECFYQEVDVVGSWKGLHVAISCKDFDEDETSVGSANEICEVVGTYYRFCLPLLAYNHKRHESVLAQRGHSVLLLGFADLSDPKRLAATIDRAIELRRTSRSQ